MRKISAQVIAIFSIASVAIADPQIVLGPLSIGEFHDFGSSVACVDRFASPTEPGNLVIAGSGNDTLVGTVRGLSGASGNNQFFSASEGNATGTFASQIVPVGDVSNDGKPDFAYGSPGGSGQVTIVSFDTPPLTTIIDGSSVSSLNAGFGASLTGMFGDISGDGVADVAIGAPDHSEDEGAHPFGQFSIWAGNGEFVMSCSGSQGERLGASLVSMGDVINGALELATGNRPDLLVGAPGANKVYIYAGEPLIEGICSERITYSAPLNAFLFGSAVANLGDITNDDVSEFLVGAPGTTPNIVGPSNGAAYLMTMLGGQTLCSLPGPSQSAFGSAVANLGDFDSDGAVEFAVAAPGANNGSGQVMIYSYDSAKEKCILEHTIDGPTGSVAFGRSISASIGKLFRCDSNGNGNNELVVGAGGNFAGSRSGAAFVYENVVSPSPSATPSPSPTVSIKNVPTPLPIGPKVVYPKRSRLGYKIAIDGSLSGIISLDTNPAGACDTTLYGRTSDANLRNQGPIQTLINPKRSKKISKFRAYGIKKVEIDQSCNKPYILHLLAKTTCRGLKKPIVSNVASRFLTCGAEPTLNLRSWEKDFSRRVH